MDNGVEVGSPAVVRLPARDIPPPALISEAARQVLATPRPVAEPYPAVSEKAAWRALVAARGAASAELTEPIAARLQADVAGFVMNGVPVYVATPRAERLVHRGHIVLDIHGGALIFGGGESSVRFEAQVCALRTGALTYALDYRVAPDHPYPAALDDCLAVYRALLEERAAGEIVVMGTSAGGNLAAALLLRARDEGLPMPGGLMLMTPELDLTESGDSFNTLMDLDVVLTSRLMPINLVYADGADLADPYLSPINADVTGFPPTLLQAGTRDLFLSNAAIMHRKLRRAGVRAELNVWEGMPHGGFGGLTPEDREMNAEMKAFIASL